MWVPRTQTDAEVVRSAHSRLSATFQGLSVLFTWCLLLFPSQPGPCLSSRLDPKLRVQGSFLSCFLRWPSAESGAQSVSVEWRGEDGVESLQGAEGTGLSE